MKLISFKSTLLTCLIVLLPLITSAQCAMCRAALETGDKQATAEGINHGITYLMIFPYVITGIIAYAIYRIYKREGHSSDTSI